MTEPRGAAFDLIIVGAGPAGLMGAVEAVRLGLKVLVIDRGRPGGVLRRISWLENVPGIPAGISGADLAARLAEHAARFGVPMERDEVRSIAPSPGGWTITGDAGVRSAPALLLATGSRPVQFGLPGAAPLIGRRIFHWTDEIPPERAGGDWCVVGGGDEAFDQAVVLLGIAASVRVLVPGVDPTAGFRAVRRAEEAGAVVSCGYRTTAVEPRNQGGVTLVTQGPEGPAAFDADGILSCLGRGAERSLLPAEATGPDDVATCDAIGRTRLPGLFVAGDIRRGPLGRIAAAAGDGILAAGAVARAFPPA